jgi:alkylhydroperoxidase/carboxymuconolactone decarboxylase family protein YurZ
MVRKGEEKVLKAMKEAKTAEEMVRSWLTQRPGFDWPAGIDPLTLYTKRKPEMVYTYAHNQLTQLVDRGILDPKTRYLVILACYMMEDHWEGVLPQCCNAKAAGATEEEIMEVAFISCYAVGKAKIVDSSSALAKVFEHPAFKNIQKLVE